MAGLLSELRHEGQAEVTRRNYPASPADGLHRGGKQGSEARQPWSWVGTWGAAGAPLSLLPEPVPEGLTVEVLIGPQAVTDEFFLASFVGDVSPGPLSCFEPCPWALCM